METKVYVLEGCHTRGTVEEVGGTGGDGGMCIRRGSHYRNSRSGGDDVTLHLIQRENLASSGKTLTKVTLESFLAWKKRKVNKYHVLGRASFTGSVPLVEGEV